VPAGIYGLEPFESEKYGKTYALENAELGVFSHKRDCDQEGDRYGILIHAGNWPSDLQGCIAPGLERTKWEDSWMVSKSRDALTDLLTLGIIETNAPLLRDLLGEWYGLAFIGISVATFVLRELTVEPVGEKQ
jgi:hypothetical protein